MTLTAGGGGAGDGAVYEWGTGAVGNGTPVTTTAATRSVAPSAAITYWVRLKGTGACSATTTGGVTTAIAANPVPVASVTARTICPGGTAALSATLGAGTTTEMTYTWNIGGTISTTYANSTTSQALTASTTYTVQLTNAYGCVGAVSAPAAITVSTISPGAINTASTTTKSGTNPSVTIANTTAASGGSGITYEWRRTGTSSATLTGTGTTYAIGTDAANYTTFGTYYFNRYAKDVTCNTAWVAATGTYTLYVVYPCPLGVSTTLCAQCCWDGAAWGDCCVTTDALSSNTQWIGGTSIVYFPGATSDRNGRANFEAITSSTVTIEAASAVGLCNALGTGWYLPAYEELVNMSPGNNTSYPPLNGRAGADLFRTSIHWSSTEYVGNGGRRTTDREAYMNSIVAVWSSGSVNVYPKTGGYTVRCAWRD
jgi:hypothetical protein